MRSFFRFLSNLFSFAALFVLVFVSNLGTGDKEKTVLGGLLEAKRASADVPYSYGESSYYSYGQGYYDGWGVGGECGTGCESTGLEGGASEGGTGEGAAGECC